MKYKPSKHFVVSASLLLLSFLILKGVIIPGIVAGHLRVGSNLAQVSSKALSYKQDDKTSIRGIFDVEHMEFFNEKGEVKIASNQPYIVDAAGRKTYLDIKPEKYENLVDKEVVYDKKAGNLLENKDPRSISSALRKGRRKGKALVFLARFENSLTDPGTPVQFKNRMFGNGFFFSPNNAYVNRFFKEMTHNKVTYGGDVFGWYEFPGEGSINSNCVLADEDIQTMANFYGVSVSDYNTVMVFTNCADYANIGGVYSGRYDVFGAGINHWVIKIAGGSNAFGVNNANSYNTIPSFVLAAIHELGHSFGLLHSKALDCDQASLGLDCSVSEYGNPFDRMGHWVGRVFGYLQQRKAGWINSDNILQIDSPGSYYIDNLQTNGGVVGAEIYVPGLTLQSPVFGLEHRKATGFDSFLSGAQYGNVTNGLILYANTSHTIWSNPWGQWWNSPSNLGEELTKYTKIVDPHPTPAGIVDDLEFDAININDTFSDPNFGVEISVTDVDESGIYFDVNYIDPPCEAVHTVDDVFFAKEISYEIGGPDNIDHQDITSPVFLPSQVASAAISFADFNADYFFDEYPVCPERNYAIVPTDDFTDMIFGGTQDFTIPVATNGSVSVPIDPIMSQPLGSYILNFKIKDLSTLDEMPIVINIYRTE